MRSMTRPNDAEVYAQEFVAKYGTTCASKLFDIAARLQLTVREVDARSFDGALIRVAGQNRGRVLLNRNVPEAGRKLFTLAHEIGHYVMPGHGREANRCRAADVETWDESVRATEREANIFAASVLMPDVVCRPFVREQPSMRAVHLMREVCGTSLTATLVRYVQLSSFPIAMAKIEHGVVKWTIRATEFTPYVRRGRVHPDSFAADAVAGKSVPNDLNAVPATAWLFDNAVIEESTILEASVAMPRYDSVVTLLYAPDRVLRWSDEPDDGELDPNEFTLERTRWPSKR